VGIAASFITPSYEFRVTCSPEGSAELRCETATEDGFGLRAHRERIVRADARRETGHFASLPSFSDVDAGFEHERSGSRLVVRFRNAESRALTSWIPGPRANLPSLDDFEARLHRGERASLSHRTEWNHFLPTLYLCALSAFVLALVSSSARVSFDPEAREPEIEIETRVGWFRRRSRTQVPLDDVEGVRMLKVERASGGTVWQVALTRHANEPVPIGVPLGRPGAARWARSLSALIDPAGNQPPPSWGE